MMGKRQFMAAAALAMVAGAPLVAAEGASTTPRNRLEGTWDVVLTFGDGSQVKSVLTVIPGATPQAGSVIHSAELSFAPPNPTLPEQGSWRRTGHRTFALSYYGFSYDLDFTPFGRIGFRHAVTLDKNGDTFTGEAVFEVFEGDAIIFSDIVQSQGVRQEATAP